MKIFDETVNLKMGVAESFNVSPQYTFSDISEELNAISCGDNSVLMIDSTKTVQIIDFEGKVFSKELSLYPSCCCATSSGGWIIGFRTGQITEFDQYLTIITSFHPPGGHKAHGCEVKHVKQNADVYSKKCHLISVGEDGVCRIWNQVGILVSEYKSGVGFTSVCSTPFFAFLSDKSTIVNTLCIDSEISAKFSLPSPAIHMAPIGEGYACIVAMKDGNVAVISSNQVLDVFSFKDKKSLTTVVPLAIEEGTGLVTYAALDSDGKITLRAFDTIISEIGDGSSLFSSSENWLVTIFDKKLFVYNIDKLRFKTMNSLPELDLPRKPISEFFSSQ